MEDEGGGILCGGTPHTGHYTFGLGACFYNSPNGEFSQAVMLEAAFYRQEMGSRASLAMQRGSVVDLGRASAVFDMSKQGSARFKAWDFTCLKVRKFRDRLGSVPFVRIWLVDFDFYHVMMVQTCDSFSME